MLKRKSNPSKENYVVASKVKDAIAKAGLRSAGDLPDAFNEMIAHKIEKAIARAKANGRATIRPEDL